MKKKKKKKKKKRWSSASDIFPAESVKQSPSKHVNLNMKEEPVEKWNLIFKTLRICSCSIARVVCALPDGKNLTAVVPVRGTPPSYAGNWSI
jgi:hypothetical protein